MILSFYRLAGKSSTTLNLAKNAMASRPKTARISCLPTLFSCALLTCALLIPTLITPAAHAAERPPLDVSFELQAYPTGVIPGVRFEYPIRERESLHVRLGMQEIRHQFWGEHDDERGDGRGGSIGYKHYLYPSQTGPSFGIRTDLWFNSLDWTDNIGQANERRGRTDVTVIQPTIELSWHKKIGKQYFITPSVGAGFEINLFTDGESVGQGFIYLAGVLFGVRF